MDEMWMIAGFAFLAVVSVALVYVAYLRDQGDPRGDELYAKIEWVVNLVKAANQIELLKKETGSNKFQWVFEQLRMRFPDVDEGDARVLIEAAVHDVKNSRQVVTIEAGDAIDDQGGAFWLNSGRHN